MLWVCERCERRSVGFAVRCLRCGGPGLSRRALAPERGRVESATTLHGEDGATTVAVVSLHDLDVFCLVATPPLRIGEQVLVEQSEAGGFVAKALADDRAGR